MLYFGIHFLRLRTPNYNIQNANVAHRVTFLCYIANTSGGGITT